MRVTRLGHSVWFFLGRKSSSSFSSYATFTPTPRRLEDDDNSSFVKLILSAEFTMPCKREFANDLLADILVLSAQSCHALGVLFRTQSGCKPRY